MKFHLETKCAAVALGAALVFGLSACGNPNTMTDKRDSKVYKTVKIGTQIWMAENLNYAGDGFCYEDNPDNCKKWGRLYTWDEAQNACPEGWHLPSKAEWKTLMDAVGGEDKAGIALKAKNSWKEYEGKSGNGTDAFGFSALPAGIGFLNERYIDADEYAIFWSSTEVDSDDIVYYIDLSYYVESARQYLDIKYHAFSVRCLENSN